MNVVVRAIVTVLVIASFFLVGNFIISGGKSLTYLIDKTLLDKGVVERNAALQTQDTEALNSMKSLTYAINRLSWFDTYTLNSNWKLDEEVNIAEELENNWYIDRGGNLVKGDAPEGYESIGNYESFGRKYGDTSVIPTIMDAYLIPYSGNDKDTILKQLAKDMVDCLTMLRDTNANIRCFAVDFGGVAKGITIKKEDITTSFKLLKKDTDMCDQTCQKYLDDIDGWWIFGRNWGFDVEGGSITNLNTRDKTIKICGDTKGLDQVFVTDSVDRCKTPADALIFTMQVANFSLPQDVNLNFWQEAFFSHGEPKYLAYYEQFPKGEDSSWNYVALGEMKELIKYQVTYQILIWGVKLIPKVGPPLAEFMSLPSTRIVVTEAAVKLHTILESISSNLEVEAFNVDSLVNGLMDSVKNLVNLIWNNKDSIGQDEASSRIRDYLTLKYGGEYILSSYFQRFSQDYFKDDTDKLNMANGLRYNYQEKLKELCDDYYKNEKDIMQEGSLNKQFKAELITKFNKINTNLDTFPEILVEDLDIFLTSEAANINFFLRAAEQSGNALVTDSDIYEHSPDNSKKDIIYLIKKNSDILEFMRIQSRAEFNRFDTEKIIVLKMLTEELDINEELKSKLGDVNQLALNLFTGIDLPTRSLPQGSEFQNMQQKTLILLNEITINTLNDMNAAEKFTPIGTNAVGLRVSYKGTVTYDDSFTKTWKWPKDSDKYLEYFKYFGGGGVSLTEVPSDHPVDIPDKYNTAQYLGLLPETNRYYLSLARDKVWYWFDQPNIRLNLVSPCKANILVKVTTCECYGKPTEEEANFLGINDMLINLNMKTQTFETGQYNSIIGEKIPNFDGENPMLYEIDPNSGQIIKQCNPKSIGDYISRGDLPWQTQPYKPLCIEFDPIMDDGTDPNYCYKGVKPGVLVVADAALNWGLPIGCSAAYEALFGAGTAASGGAAAPTLAGGPVAWALCSIAGNIVYSGLENSISSWPAHGSSFV